MALSDHLATGVTSVARCWAVTRRDGVVLGFTDHDRDIAFEGIRFAAATGLTARALRQTTGLAVDNSEAVGALSDPAIREADVLAGRFDGAEVRAWRVNWADPEERALEFRGTMGEILRQGEAFQAELRGLSELLNVPQGRVYQRACSAILGDGSCGFDLSQPGYTEEARLISVHEGGTYGIGVLDGLPARWFERGRLEVLDGAAAGMTGIVKEDLTEDAGRRIVLWEGLRGGVAAGDRVRLVAGCDKRPESCKAKFANFLNFRGFPHIPGEDWLISYPTRAGENDGGRLR